MTLRNSPTMIRRPGDAAERAAGTPNAERAHPAEMTRIVKTPDAEDALGRVMTELSHDLRQPLTSLHMNLQSAVKLLQQPTPHIPAVLDALTDCLSTERDMVELLSHANRRAAALSGHPGSFALNDLAREVVLTAQGLEPSWRVRLGERFTTPSPMVAPGILRLRLALLSMLRRALILDELERSKSDGIVVETLSSANRAELRLTGLPRALPTSSSFTALHELMATIVRGMHGAVSIAATEARSAFIISLPQLAPVVPLEQAGNHGE
ncbi:MAG TPA: hypothetical protein VFD67_03085 [Gemmatimonadaceae bacterium]|nr:hypothetical protein [Gemmatimonadaceae bacterium]